MSASLSCRMCGRPVGDIVGHPGAPLGEARFIALPTGTLPAAVRGTLRCAHCHGQLHLVDIQPLGGSVSLWEVGGQTVREVLQDKLTSDLKSAA